MPDILQKYGAKPFQEAVDFFKDKVNMLSEKWDDLWKEQHAKGFMVAGAMKADLLTDLRAAVDKAITQGTTLADFRKDFDDIVAKRGWVYKGGRNWRTKVIYDTNLRQAYNAGRYKQMADPDVTALRPYLQYRHGDSRNPRPQHLAWDGLVLRHDDPFWATHKPQNGWGCKCGIVTLSERDLAKLGKSGPDSTPKIETVDYKNPQTGKIEKVPKGIDPGFDYDPSQAGPGFKILANKFETLPYDIAEPAMRDFLKGPAFERFFEGKIKGEFPVAVLSEIDKAALDSQAQTVWLSRATLDEHKIKHPEITLEDYRNIPEIIKTGEVYKQGDARLVYLKYKGKLYRAALKRTQDGGENYYLTLFETSEDKADREIREKLERIR